MVAIRIKNTGDQNEVLKLGEQICEALRGNKALRDSDLLVNYDDDPDFILICLGENNDQDVVLDVAWPVLINGRETKGGCQ